MKAHAKGICEACGRSRYIQARRMCKKCYLMSLGKYAHQAIYESVGEVTDMPDQPTQAMPGSKEKIAVMRERVAKRQVCFHPDDASARSELGCRAKNSEPAAVRRGRKLFAELSRRPANPHEWMHDSSSEVSEVHEQ